MEDINTRIEKILRLKRKQRLKRIAAWLSGVLIFAVVMLALIIPPMGKGTIVHGKVETMVGRPSEIGNLLYLVVKLEDGTKVRPSIPSAVFYEKGHVVKLEKKEPLYFGRTSYRFMGYEELPLSE